VTVLRKENRYGRKGRVFPLDYKLTVVRRWNAGESVSAMARELGIRRKVLYEWKDRYRKLGEAGLRPAGRPKASSVRATGGGGRCQSRRVADGAGADWGVGAQGGATGAGIGFFRRGLAANPGGEARRTSFCELIAERAPQGELSIEKMCQLGGVSRATYYRHWIQSAPRHAETVLRGLLHKLSLENRYYGH